MTKTILSSAALALAALATPGVARAQTAPAAPAAPETGAPSCPPGSWFCAGTAQDPAAPAGKGAHGLQALPDPDAEGEGDADAAPADGASEPPAPPPPAHRPKRRHYAPPPPPVVVYQPAPPPTVVVARPEPYEYTPPPREPISRPREWGLNLHVEGAAFGHGAGNAGMGGAGVGLRFKPNRYLGIETDFDIVGGRDYQGDRRTETAFTIDGLLFLNPRSRAQVYLLAGFGWSGAHVTCDNGCSSGAPGDAHYTYFGGQLGGGLEVRLSRAIALHADVRGFLRTRVDDGANAQPEFTDQYGRTTNTSCGALFTGGMVVYF